jgi:hypothetical protein
MSSHWASSICAKSQNRNARYYNTARTQSMIAECYVSNRPLVRPYAVRLLQATAALEAEILILRHQLNVLQQRAPRRRLHLPSFRRARER